MKIDKEGGTWPKLSIVFDAIAGKQADLKTKLEKVWDTIVTTFQHQVEKCKNMRQMRNVKNNATCQKSPSNVNLRRSSTAKVNSLWPKCHSPQDRLSSRLTKTCKKL